MKPTPYEIEKLRTMAQANQAELAAIKQATAAGAYVDQRRVRKLHRAVKAQVKLERELERRQRLNGPDILCAGCQAPATITKPVCDKCLDLVRHRIGGKL